jgi:hypothetical protein
MLVVAEADTCSQCGKDAARFYPVGPLLVEWSSELTVDEDSGCIAELFCSWTCAARWFCGRAGLEAPTEGRRPVGEHP